MVQIIEQPGSILGQLGKGFGQGLSEQLPKGIDRGQLSYGLKNLKSTGDPMRDLSSLYGIPGMTPEIANQAQQYMRQQALINEGRQNAQKIPIDQQGTSGGGQSPQEPISLSPDKEEPRRLINTPEAIREGGQEYARKFPLRYGQDIEAGEKRYAADVATQEKQLADVTSDYDNILEKYLQKQGGQTFSDVFGTQQDSFKRQAEDAVLSGKMTSSQAARKYGQEALDFGETRQRLKTIGMLSQGTRASKNESFDAIREDYKRLGRLKEFADDLRSTTGMSRGASSYIAYPPDKNSALQKELNSSFSTINKIKSSFINPKRAEKIGKYLTDDDSLQAIAFQIGEKGGNSEQFMSEMQKLYRQDKVKLTDRQARELQEPVPQSANLNDTYFFAFGGRK